LVLVSCADPVVVSRPKRTKSEAAANFTLKPPTTIAAIPLSKSFGENKRGARAIALWRNGCVILLAMTDLRNKIVLITGGSGD